NVTIRPQSASLKTISGTFAGGLIRLNGADRVTIDGRFSGSGNYLTITNTALSGSIAAIQLISLGTGQGAENVTVRNCNISTGFNGATSYGIAAGGATVGTAGDDNDNLTITENNISKANYGIFVRANATGVINNLNITKNNIGSNTVADYIGKYGIDIAQASTVDVSENTIFNIKTSNNNLFGISIATGVSGATISKNMIYGINYTGTAGYGGKGIDINTGLASSNITIVNNVIYDIGGDGWNNLTSDANVGIRILGTTGGINIYHNSVNLYGTWNRSATATVSAALYLPSGISNIDLRNNVLSNSIVNTLNTGAKSYAIYVTGTSSVFSTVNYNDYYASGSQGVLGYLTSDRTTLADWQTATGQDQLSVSRDPLFTSATNLLPTDFNGYFATPISGITTDINGTARSASAPAKGAYEGTVPGVWLGGTSVWHVGTNWSNGSVPAATTVTAVLNSTVTQPEITTAVSLTEPIYLNTGCSLTVGAGGSLTTSELVNYGSVILAATASGYGSLLENTVRGTGTIRREMYLNAGATPPNARWFTIGSPFAVPINQLHDGTSEFNVTSATESPFWKWDASAGNYTTPASATENFERGRGYVAYFGTSAFGTFIRPVPGVAAVTGSYGSAANLTVTLGYTNTPTFPTIDGPTDGWNLQSNAYLTSYDWNGQTLGPNTGAAIYVRNSANTGWVTWNTSETSNRRYIPPMQGFWIRTTASENLTFDIAQRNTNSTQVIEKPQSTEVLTRIRVTNTQNGIADQADISFHTNGTQGFDRLYDGYKLRNDAGMHNVYSRSQNLSLALNYLPPLQGSASVPVWFENDVQGSYSFAINRDEIDPAIEITLEDKQTNATFTFQTSQSAYTFSHTPQMSKDRFVLHYNKVNIGQDEFAGGRIQGLQGWYYDGRIHVKSIGFSGPVTARLVDVTGKRIAEEVLVIGSGELTRWSLPVLRPGVYLVQLISREGQTTVRFVY
ncbi:MAG: beta strand repeat-containing protein, partial [Thermaurantimonas sp.]